MSDTVAVVGLGYIGLPTAVVLAVAGQHVTGVDVSDRIIEHVNQGELPFVEPGLELELNKAITAGMLVAQKETPKARVYIISVPTPFKDGYELDPVFIDAAIDNIIPQLEGDELIILESTSPPGTTEYVADRVFAARPDLSLDGAGNTKVIHFAHAPERVLPGRIMAEMRSNDRIIGGVTLEATERAVKVYELFTEGKIFATNARTAELAKLTENAYRDVNIAFANELSVIADDLDIDVWELIELANRHPRVDILKPGPGVGGHCIAVDPWFIVSSAPESAKLIRNARIVNDSKPDWVISKVARQLVDVATEGKELIIGAFGLAFKPNVDDLRQSPALTIVERLAAEYENATILVVEPFVEELPRSLAALRNVEFVTAEDALERANIVVGLVAHSQFAKLGEKIPKDTHIVDTTGQWMK